MQLRVLLSVFNRRLLILPPIVIGAIVLYVVVSSRNVPRQEIIPEASRPLLVIEAPRTTVVPRVLALALRDRMTFGRQSLK